MQHFGGGTNTAIDVPSRQLGLLQAESHVVIHGHMRIESIGLKHHGHAALRWRNIIDSHITNIDVPAGDVFKSGDHPQQRGLATTRRTDKHHEFTIIDAEVNIMYDADVAIGLLDVRQSYAGHLLSTSSIALTMLGAKSA